MKHTTCDKCGLPMESRMPVRIDHRIYDLCNECENKIMDGLQGKGEIIQGLIPPELQKFQEYKSI